MTENKHKVPKRQWNRWNHQEQRRFNYLYELIVRNQLLFSHPEAPIMHEKHWKTFAWNAAWSANDV